MRLISRGEELPVVAFTTSDEVRAWDVFAVSRRLRERGWQVPAYTFPPNREDLAVLRIVCRNAFTPDLADLLLTDLRGCHRRAQRRARSRHGQRAAGIPSLGRHQDRDRVDAGAPQSAAHTRVSDEPTAPVSRTR